MPENDEIYPNWDKKNVPAVGVYIWTLKVLKVTSKDPSSSKPYVLVHFQVLSGDYLGHEFDARVYYHSKSERWCRFFLKKFGYDAKLLEGEKPVIKLGAMVNLSGKARVEVTISKDEHSGEEYLNEDLKGFSRLEETELEEKLAKERKGLESLNSSSAAGDTLPLQPAEQKQESIPDLDINADIREERERQANSELAALDSSYVDGIDDPEDLGLEGM